MQKQYSHSKTEALLLTETKEHSWMDPQCTSTPKQRRQLEFVSPYIRETEKDLFSQLLGTETRYISPLTKSIAPVKLDYSTEELEISEQDDDDCDDQLMEIAEESSGVDNKEDLRKRKRKSNAQLKLLKQEFDRDEGGWNKERIIRMAEITGLSESQVYKWCWDQKKKTNTRRFDSDDLDCKDEDTNEDKRCPKTRLIKKEIQTKRKMGSISHQ